MEQFAIHTEYIQLNQLLKLLGWVESGADANEAITAGEVQVNNAVELRKRNKIYPGMRVTFDHQEIEIIAT
jgi:ribosome-associated protein